MSQEHDIKRLITMPVTSRSLALQWVLADRQLKRAKDAELALRKTLAERLFPNPKLGTNTAPITNSASIKLVHSYNYKLNQDQALLNAAYHAVHAIDPDAANRLYKVKYELNETEYKALSVEARDAFDKAGALTINAATPQVKLHDPQNEFAKD